MKERRLVYLPTTKNAGVIAYPDGTILLRSYKTIVAEIHDGWISCNGTYSATTRRHLGAFAKEFGTSYQTLKALFENNFQMDLETGEVVERA